MLDCNRLWLRGCAERREWIVAFNVYDLTSVSAILRAAAQKNKPVLLALGERYLQQAPMRAMTAMIKELLTDHPAPVGLHLDHTRSVSVIQQALDCGFTSVMFDGSSLPLEENIRLTAEVVSMAHGYGAAAEGELGGLNDEMGEAGTCCFTQPAQAALFARETNVDMLAISAGNRHGAYSGTPALDLNLIDQIYQAAQVPLVLHGCSGLSSSQLLSAVEKGVLKLNVNTEIAQAGAQSMLACPSRRMDSMLAAAIDGMCTAALPFFDLSF